MSTETINNALPADPMTEDYIPGDDEVETVASSQSFRFSKGRIVSGREEDGTLVVRPKIVGRVTRIGIHEAVTNDQYAKPIKQIECDIMTRDGEVYLKASLLDEDFEFKVSGAALSFAWCLNTPNVRERQIVQFSASQGEAWTDEKGRAMSASTYCNIFEVRGKQAYPIYRPKADPNAPKRSMEEKFAEIEAELRAHPLFGPRPEGRAGDGGDRKYSTHLSELTGECQAKGWPTPEQAPLDWLAMAAAAIKNGDGTKKYDGAKLGSLGQVDDHDWGHIRQAVGALQQIDPSKARQAAGFDGPSDAWKAATGAAPADTNAFG